MLSISYRELGIAENQWIENLVNRIAEIDGTKSRRVSHYAFKALT